MSTGSVEGKRDLLQTAALLIGIVFVLVAILGFVPGITTDGLKFAGPDSEAKLLGLFQVSVLHNIVHLLFGVGILMSRTRAGAKNYLIGGGIIYLVLVVVGLVIAGKETNINFVPINGTDNILHLGLGVAMLGLGLVLGKNTSTTRA